MQGDEVFLARMALPCRGRLCPAGEPRVSLTRGQTARLLEPSVEVIIVLLRVAAEEAAHVVIAHPASNEDDAFVAERGERGTEGNMSFRIEAAEE